MAVEVLIVTYLLLIIFIRACKIYYKIDKWNFKCILYLYKFIVTQSVNTFVLYQQLLCYLSVINIFHADDNNNFCAVYSFVNFYLPTTVCLNYALLIVCMIWRHEKFLTLRYYLMLWPLFGRILQIICCVNHVNRATVKPMAFNWTLPLQPPVWPGSYLFMLKAPAFTVDRHLLGTACLIEVLLCVYFFCDVYL